VGVARVFFEMIVFEPSNCIVGWPLLAVMDASLERDGGGGPHHMAQSYSETESEGEALAAEPPET